MKSVIGVLFLVSCAFAALEPGISASVSLLSLQNMVHGLTPLIIPSVLTTDTVLLNNLTVGNSLGSITVNNMKLKSQIDMMHTKIDFGVKNETSLRFSITNLTAELVFDYVLNILGKHQGTGDVGVTDLSFNITATLKESDKSWTMVFEQEMIKLTNLAVDMKPSIIDDIAYLLQGRLENQILTVFPNTVLPILNKLVADYASIPSDGTIFIDTEYFLNLTLSKTPTFNADVGYVEAMMNGLVYSNSTKQTTAVHDITPATRDLNAQSWQVYVSDNTFTSMLPALISSFKVTSLTLPLPEQELGLLFMIFPNIKEHYGEGESYSVSVDLNEMNPVVTISGGKAMLENFHVNVDLIDSKANTFAVLSMNLTLTVEAEINSQKKIILGINGATIEKDSLSISQTFDLGRNLKSTELLLDSLLRIGQKSITQMFQSFSIASLLPAQYQYALFLLKNIELSFDREHFLKFGFSYSLDP